MYVVSSFRLSLYVLFVLFGLYVRLASFMYLSRSFFLSFVFDLVLRVATCLQSVCSSVGAEVSYACRPFFVFHVCVLLFYLVIMVFRYFVLPVFNSLVISLCFDGFFMYLACVIYVFLYLVAFNFFH